MAEDRLGAEEPRAPGRSWTAWAVQGAIGGVIAGIIFAMFEMGWALAAGGVDMAFAPLRMIGAIALGRSALDPSYSLLTAAIAGVLVHMVLSIIYGAAFALAIGALAPRAGTWQLVASGVVFGLALWVVNFFVIGPVAGWTWFAEMTDPVVQAVAHGGFFGIVLAVYLSRFAPQEAEPGPVGSAIRSGIMRRT